MNADFRNRALQARRSMSDLDRRIASEKICNRVTHSREFLAANKIGCYMPMRDEVDPSRIIERAWRANKRIFCPVMKKNGEMIYRRLDRNTTLLRNGFGLWEPFDSEIIAPRQLDVVITPLVAFDRNLHRIGMGGGYFDRCFSFLRHRRQWISPKLIGVAFACQETEAISPNPWDIRLYALHSDTTC